MVNEYLPFGQPSCFDLNSPAYDRIFSRQLESYSMLPKRSRAHEESHSLSLYSPELELCSLVVVVGALFVWLLL